MGVAQQRKDGKRSVVALGRVDRHDVARIPAQEGRPVIAEQRGANQVAGLAVRDRLVSIGIEHLEYREVGPDPEPLARRALGGQHADLGHAETVEDRRAPIAFELVPLGRGKRLGGAEHSGDGTPGEVDTLRIGEVGEVQAIARHAHPDRGLERLDQSQLLDRRQRRTGPRPNRPHPHDLRRPRPHMPHRVDAERRRDMRLLVLRAVDSRRGEGADEADHVEQDVFERLRVEQRLAGAPARTPVLAHRLFADGAEILVEPLGGHLPKFVLGQDRDFRPFLGIVELVGIDPLQKRAPERGTPGALDGDALAPPLYGLDLLGAFRDAERKVGIDPLPPGQPLQGAHSASSPPR